MRRAHTPSQSNRHRKHPLDAQADADLKAGTLIMATSLVCAFLLSLPFMSRARFDAPNELEREPMENKQTMETMGEDQQ